MAETKFIDSFKLASALHERYQTAPQVGWDQSGKRGKDNHTILVNRTEVLDTTDRLVTMSHIASVYAFERLNLIDMLEQLAKGKHDATICPNCNRIYQTGWMNGQCIYCDCHKNAANSVQKLLEKPDV